MLLAEIGMSFENTHQEVWKELHRVQQDYESAIKDLSMMIKVANTTKRQPHIMTDDNIYHPKNNDGRTPEKGEYGLPKDENYVAEILKKEMGVS